jgi:hypothetical protein
VAAGRRTGLFAGRVTNTKQEDVFAQKAAALSCLHACPSAEVIVNSSCKRNFFQGGKNERQVKFKILQATKQPEAAIVTDFLPDRRNGLLRPHGN